MLNQNLYSDFKKTYNIHISHIGNLRVAVFTGDGTFYSASAIYIGVEDRPAINTYSSAYVITPNSDAWSIAELVISTDGRIYASQRPGVSEYSSVRIRGTAVWRCNN